MTDQERRRLRQRWVEVLASEVLAIPKGTLASWRTASRVPHRHRIELLMLGEAAGLPLDAARDFEGWQKVGER